MLFAFVGEAGNTILFVATLVYTAIVAIYFLAYAAHCFLVVVQDTAAGIDEVAWPDEPISDWVGRAAYLLALVALLLAPAGMLARALRRVWLPEDPALRFLLLAVPGLWLLFPIGLLSAMSSASSWTILRPAILRQFLRLFPTVAGFYLLTGLLLLAAAV